MPGPDATASAALLAAEMEPCFVGWLDFVGDPVRVTTAPYDVTFSGTGDADLDGFTFSAMSSQFIGISDIQHREQGMETVTVTLSGLIGIDTALLNIIGDQTKWRGRDGRLWVMLYDTSLNRVGNIWPLMTGTMAKSLIKGSGEEQSIDLSIENYLAALRQATNRNYLDQARYDPGDLSADAAISIANGTGGAGLVDPLGGGGGVAPYRGGGGRGLFERADKF